MKIEELGLYLIFIFYCVGTIGAVITGHLWLVIFAMPMILFSIVLVVKLWPGWEEL